MAAGEQRPGLAGPDVQPEQLGQLAPDRHLLALAAFTVLDRDDVPGGADTFNPELHQLYARAPVSSRVYSISPVLPPWA